MISDHIGIIHLADPIPAYDQPAFVLADDAHVGSWRSIGENIAFSRGYKDPVALTIELWLDSPSHRHNMMDANWKESAIGVAVAQDGSYYFTQVFLLRK